jgi:hypothetical protein
VFYPPATGVAMLPFAFVPFRVGQALWFVLMVASVVVGIRALVRLVEPEAPSYVWSCISGIVLLSSCIRWGLTPLQGAPFVLGLLCIFFVLLERGYIGWAAAVAAYATAFKMTLAVPFLGLLFLHRRHVAWCAVLGIWLLLNALGFLRIGGMDAFRTYTTSMSGLESMTGINTPDPWRDVSEPRTDLTYFFYGIAGHLQFARLAAKGLSGLLGLWLAARCLKFRKPNLAATAAFMMPFAILTLISVYHHQYDLSILIAPLVIMVLRPESLGVPRWALVLMTPLVAVMTFAPVGMLHHLSMNYLGAESIGVVNLMYPVCTVLALLGSLVVLERQVRSVILLDKSPTAN